MCGQEAANEGVGHDPLPRGRGRTAGPGGGPLLCPSPNHHPHRLAAHFSPLREGRAARNQFQHEPPTTPIALQVKDVSKFYGSRIGCRNVSLELGPVKSLPSLVESGSGKTTLLSCLLTGLMPSSGVVENHMRDVSTVILPALGQAERRFLMPTRLGFRASEPGGRPAHDGFGRRQCRRAADGGRRPALRQYPAPRWPTRCDASRSRKTGSTTSRGLFPGGMRQRLQIARNLVTSRVPRVHG